MLYLRVYTREAMLGVYLRVYDGGYTRVVYVQGVQRWVYPGGEREAYTRIYTTRFTVGWVGKYTTPVYAS